MSRLVICPTCEKLGHRQRPKSFITLALTLIGLRRSAANPTIDQLSDRGVLIFSDISMSLARFLFSTKIIFSFIMGITHHALLNCKLSVPYPRRACNDSGEAVTQRLSGRIVFTVSLGQVYKSCQIPSLKLSQPHKDRQLSSLLTLTA